MIEFKSLAPSYSSAPVINGVDGLRELGCSETLIENILVGDASTYQPLVAPEEWYWADVERFGTGGPWVDELYRLSGGGFINLPFEKQAELLCLPVKAFFKAKAPSKRGRWLLRSSVEGSIEEAALEELLKSDEQGFNAEGDYLSIIFSMTVQVARSMFKKKFELDQATSRNLQTERHHEQMLEALGLLLNNIEELIEPLWQKLGRAFAGRSNMTRESLSQFIVLIGTDFLSRILTHYIVHRLVAAGHPDLTIIGPDGIRFVEVKGHDRLRGSQAMWIKNVARPLGLDVGIARVTAHK